MAKRYSIKGFDPSTDDGLPSKKPYKRVMFFEDGSSSMAPKKKGLPHLPSPAQRQTYKGAYGSKTSPPGSKRGLV